MTVVDPIDVLEIAYAAHDDERAWLAAVAATMRPFLDPERLALHAYVASGPRTRRNDVILAGRYPAERLTSMLASPLAYPPVTQGVARDMMRTLATSRGICSMRELAGPSVSEFWGHGVHDSVAFLSADGQGRAVVIAALASRAFQLGVGDHGLWRRVAVHVGAAHRLLTIGRELDAENVEAVLAADGRVVDARGPARAREATECLRRAVRDLDRARSRRRRADAEAALTAWSGLFAGRWSLVDHFDSDGRRFLVARRNDPDSPVPGALTRRHRQVAFYASLGWTNKEIAYALGIAQTTVSMHLGEALARLGLRSRMELVQVATRLAIEAFEAGRGEPGLPAGQPATAAIEPDTSKRSLGP